VYGTPVAVVGFVVATVVAAVVAVVVAAVAVDASAVVVDVVDDKGLFLSIYALSDSHCSNIASAVCLQLTSSTCCCC
jgi:hypothetical protein